LFDGRSAKAGVAPEAALTPSANANPTTRNRRMLLILVPSDQDSDLEEDMRVWTPVKHEDLRPKGLIRDMIRVTHLRADALGRVGNLVGRAIVSAPMPFPSAARLRHLPASMALAGLLVAACAGGQPSPSPGASRSPGSSLSPSSVPTVGLSASPSPGRTGQLGEIDHRTEPTAVVLRMSVNGGFVPREVALIEVPTFTLFGDGSVVFRPSQAPGQTLRPGRPRPVLTRATMRADQVDALLRFALTQGGLRDAKADYSDVGVADAPTTVFTIDAGGVRKQVLIVALGVQAAGQDAGDRARFAVLAGLLDSFETELARGNVESPEPYRPPSYRAYLVEDPADQKVAPIAWPWHDLTVGDFPVTAESGFPNRNLTPQQVGLVTDEPNGGVYGIHLKAPDGKVYQSVIRPLLPDEVA
jgi:hypothetical protein